MTTKKLTNVYVVEDAPEQRTILSDHLSKYSGIKIKGFFSGDACIKEIVDNAAVQPDLVLLDYYLDALPGLNTMAWKHLQRSKNSTLMWK